MLQLLSQGLRDPMNKMVNPLARYAWQLPSRRAEPSQQHFCFLANETKCANSV
jgi:hypothetical protein